MGTVFTPFGMLSTPVITPQHEKQEKKPMDDGGLDEKILDELEARDPTGFPPRSNREKVAPTLARQYLPGTYIVKELPKNLPELDKDGLMPLVVAPSHEPENDKYVLVVRKSPNTIWPKVGVVIHLTKVMYNGSIVYVYD